jgi:nucleotide-binding universal stress UspA family protein
MAELRRILVPTDFTETSDHALDWAIDLAKRLGASITVLHTYEIPVVGFPDGAIIATPEIAGRIADASRTALEATMARIQTCGVPLDSLLREGVPWEEINSVAEALPADLVVIGTHGRRGLTRALLGSVADKVVRTANRPIVTIRGH